MVLMPVGIINERHEPPVYYGVERPFVDTVIVPTTWFETGVGVHGEVGRGWRYRGYSHRSSQRRASSPPRRAFGKGASEDPGERRSRGRRPGAWSMSACVA